MLVKSSDRTAVHAGHLYINGCHWIYRCPLCLSLMAKADAIAKESDENQTHHHNHRP